MSPTPKRRYGWRPDTPDLRDLRYASPRADVPLPAALRDLPRLWPAVDDQKSLGCCTGFGCEFLWRASQIRSGLPDVEPGSRLFVYWAERYEEGTTAEDAGAQIRTGLKVLAKRGVPAEDLWPYRVSRFATRPTEAAFRAAKRRQVLRYARVRRTLRDIKSAVADRRPVVFGFTVYESFEGDAVAADGLVPVPGPGERSLGGHCSVIVGWDDAVRCPGAAPGAVLVRNSYGARHGIKPTEVEPHLAGHFWLPYQLVLEEDFADDFWTVFEVEGAPEPAA